MKHVEFHAIPNGGDVVLTRRGDLDVGQSESSFSKEYCFSRNYPNSFNPTTIINFDLAKSDNASIRVYDMLGRPNTTLLHGELQAGHHAVIFIASNLASGVYFYSLKAGDFSSVK